MSLDRTSKQMLKRPWLRAFFRLAAPAFALLLLAGFARPAHAGDEFERAFKYELGRIAAHEAVYVLGAIVQPGPARVYARPAAVYVAPAPVQYHYHYYAPGHRHDHHRHHGRHHDHY